MRVAVVALAALLLAAGCGSKQKASQPTSAPAGTLKALYERPGEDVGLVFGSSDFVPGVVRVSFLVIRHDASAVVRPRARIWIARALEGKAFLRATAALEPIGVPGLSSPAAGHVTKIYVTRFRIRRPGRYWLLAEPVGGKPVQGLGIVDVQRRPQAAGVGSKAFPSPTPTLASAHGDAARLTTRTPPDTALLRYSIAGSLNAHKPFVVTFATPKFCTSRTCGPVVDVVERVRRRFARTGIRFLHVEVYRKNKPSLGYNRWMREWHLASEPWTFLVGRDGRIKERFAGSVSVAELTAAIRRTLR